MHSVPFKVAILVHCICNFYSETFIRSSCNFNSETGVQRGNPHSDRYCFCFALIDWNVCVSNMNTCPNLLSISLFFGRWHIHSNKDIIKRNLRTEISDVRTMTWLFSNGSKTSCFITSYMNSYSLWLILM